MNIVITGGAGFLGVLLARTLIKNGSLALNGSAPQAVSSITLVDRAQPPADLMADARVRAVVGDLNDLLASKQALPAGSDIVFHLAAAVSAECEADFDLGMRSNFAATHQLLEACRAQTAAGKQPAMVFASSLAVFGDSPQQPLPAVITDTTLPTPQGSYGIQKFIGEQMVSDYARKGFVKGRSVRLMTVSVRPGKPNGAASGFLSGMIREPLAGLRAQVPVPASTPVALASPARTIEGILRAAEVSDEAWGARTSMNLPAIRTTVGDMAAALEKVAGAQATALLDWKLDPATERLVGSWPSNVDAARARSIGLQPDTSFEDIVRGYIAGNPDAVTLK
jgi:nucleoside-diphosphate-sugar epimerase